MKIFLVGGFLGSGKTTAMINACNYLTKRNIRVAVITNDQGEQQVDSATVKSFGIPHADVVNGCFCCNYNELDKHISTFVETIDPEIIFAESVGSCTDLVATVAKPLMMNKEDLVTISVFVEASLLLALLGNRASFISNEVRYIYKKQLEEADILVINKVDCIDPSQKSLIDDAIKLEFPGKTILYQDSTNLDHIEHWISKLENFKQPSQRASLHIDYDIYAKGEAALAWMDENIFIDSPGQNVFDIANELIRDIHQRLIHYKITIGHLKFFIECDDVKRKISITTTSPVYSYLPETYVSDFASLLINARVQTEPVILETIINDSYNFIKTQFNCVIDQLEKKVFKPGYPRPTYRIS